MSQEEEAKVALKLQEFREDFSLFIEAGFVAVKQSDELGAKRLFCGAQILDRFHTAPQIGFGYIALNKLQIKEALSFFEAILNKEQNYLAQTFTGICYLLSKNKRKKGEKLIHEAMEKSADSTIQSLGTVALEWSEKDLAKPENAKKLVELPE
jgi:hypothetical protein